MTKLLDFISPPTPPPAGGFVDLPEKDAGCTPFAALNERGEIYVIGYRGEWYTVPKMTWRVRLHNWIVSRYNRKLEEVDSSG